MPIRARSHSRSESYTGFTGHPAATRASLVQTAQDMALATSPQTRKSLDRLTSSQSRQSVDVSQESLQHGHIRSLTKQGSGLDDIIVTSPLTAQSTSENTPLLHGDLDEEHSDDNLSPSGSLTSDSHGQHGHSHSESGSMNMRALLLHVLGDALGNVGVIAT